MEGYRDRQIVWFMHSLTTRNNTGAAQLCRQKVNVCNRNHEVSRKTKRRLRLATHLSTEGRGWRVPFGTSVPHALTRCRRQREHIDQHHRAGAAGHSGLAWPQAIGTHEPTPSPWTSRGHPGRSPHLRLRPASPPSGSGCWRRDDTHRSANIAAAEKIDHATLVASYGSFYLRPTSWRPSVLIVSGLRRNGLSLSPLTAAQGEGGPEYKAIGPEPHTSTNCQT